MVLISAAILLPTISPALTIRTISRMIWTARSDIRKSLSRHLGRDRVLAIGQPEAEMKGVRCKDGIPPTAGGGPVDARHLREIVGAVFVLGISEALRLEEPESVQWD